MAKYSNGFKLKVVQYHLQGQGVGRTAKVFFLDSATVHKWVSRYILHGEDGINRRSGITVYPLDFKLNAIRMVMNEGLSQKEASARLNLPTNSIPARWLRRYRQYGIDGLKPKPKGRKPVKSTNKLKPPKKPTISKPKKS